MVELCLRNSNLYKEDIMHSYNIFFYLIYKPTYVAKKNELSYNSRILNYFYCISHEKKTMPVGLMKNTIFIV
ncbi:hypothetical protein BTXL6_10060 [Bacillus thuringiensis]|nr:hypothetical protein BTXL6_27625 [Bacillus thuringiensis]ALL21787.1 hypothetical protein BTXL6_10060 [Bacillus thuringiensis]